MIIGEDLAKSNILQAVSKYRGTNKNCATDKSGKGQPICSMPQIFMVVRCYACSVFQVQQVKKIPKWVCKMCGEKQSLKKEYGRGSGADCRQHVQKLNLLKASMENEPSAIRSHAPDDDWDHEGVQRHDDGHYEAQECEEQRDESSKQTASTSSVWSQFMTDPKEHPTPDGLEPQSSHKFDNNRMTTDRDVLKGQRKRGGKRGSSTGNKWSGAGRKFKRKSFQNDIDEEDFCHEQQGSVSSPSYGYNEYPPDTRTWQNKNQANHSAKRSFTTTTQKSSNASSTSALPSSNGRWGQFLKESTHYGDAVGNDGLIEENTTKSISYGPSKSLTTASHKSPGASCSSVPPKPSARWGHFLTRSHHQEDGGNDVGLVKENTTNSSSSKPCASSSTKRSIPSKPASSTTSTSSKWGQFLDNNAADDGEDESSEEFWPEDHDQIALLNQERGPYSQQNLEAKSTFDDNELMPNDGSQASSIDGLKENTITGSSVQAPGIAIGDPIGDQNVDSLQGSSRWNVFLSSKSNESHLGNSPRKTGTNVVDISSTMSQSENKLIVTGNKAQDSCQNNGSSRESMVQSRVDGNMLCFL